MGGVGHVLIKDYYVALILAQLRTWFPQSLQERWQELEESQTSGNNLYDLLMTSKLIPIITTTLSPSMKASLQAWKVLITMQDVDPPTVSLPLPISSLDGIIPDLHIKHWLDKGIKTINDLMIGPTIKTFRAVQLE